MVVVVQAETGGPKSEFSSVLPIYCVFSRAIQREAHMKEMIRIKWLLGHTQRDAAKRTGNVSLSVCLGHGKDRNGHAVRPMSAGAPNGATHLSRAIRPGRRLRFSAKSATAPFRPRSRPSGQLKAKMSSSFANVMK